MAERDSRPPVLLLHAFPLDARMWDEVAEDLGNHGVPSIAVDAPGFGSSPLLPDGEPSLDHVAAAVAATLEDLEIDRVVVAGVSMGGYTALALAQQYPHHVAGLALIDTKATADSEQAAANRRGMAERALGGEGAHVLTPMVGSLLGETTQREAPELTAQITAWAEQVAPESIAYAQRAMAARPDRLDVLRRARGPVLVLRGEEDTLATQADGRSMAQAARDSGHPVTEIELAQVGHLSPMEDPGPVADALVALWTSIT